jgi:hypothetical protein
VVLFKLAMETLMKTWIKINSTYYNLDHAQTVETISEAGKPFSWRKPFSWKISFGTHYVRIEDCEETRSIILALQKYLYDHVID